MGGLGLLLSTPCSVRLYSSLILVSEGGASAWLVAVAVRAESVVVTEAVGLVAPVRLDLWQPIEDQPLHEDPEPATQTPSLSSIALLLLLPRRLPLWQWRVSGAMGVSWALQVQLGQQTVPWSLLPPIFRMMVILGQKHCLTQEMQLQAQRTRSCCF